MADPAVNNCRMYVLVLTVFLSLVLAAIFVVLFFAERRRGGLRGAEQDALLPFTDERPAARHRRGRAD
jgi:hypothetical protein